MNGPWKEIDRGNNIKLFSKKFLREARNPVLRILATNLIFFLLINMCKKYFTSQTIKIFGVDFSTLAVN